MTKGPCPSGVSQSNRWLHRLKEPVIEPTPTKMVMEQEKPLSPQRAHPLLRWAAAKPPNPPTTALRGPGPGVRRLGVRWKLGQITLGLDSLIYKMGRKMPCDPQAGSCSVQVSRREQGRAVVKTKDRPPLGLDPPSPWVREGWGVERFH